MIQRAISSHILSLAAKYPVISVTGPRQSGKTTLVRSIFPQLEYVNFEDQEIRSLAEQDPKRFFKRYSDGLIIDEAQYVPSLFSYIQLEADNRRRPGEFVLTGSQHFLFMEKITQSLAGRVAIFNLLPFSVRELKNTPFYSDNPESYLFQGMYPGLYEMAIDPAVFYSNYTQSYVERDVRQLVNISDLSKFRTFSALCAGRIGQLYNQTSLGNDLDIDHKTADRWFSILETSFIAFTLRPYFRNFNKRILKTPKLYFYDTGLACSLLGIRSEEQLDKHPMRGALFENFVIVEVLKNFINRGVRPNLYFWRDQTGNEIDLLVDEGGTIYPVEIKSAHTFKPEFFKGLNYFNTLASNAPGHSYLVYGGDQNLDGENGNIRSWNNLPDFTG